MGATGREPGDARRAGRFADGIHVVELAAVGPDQVVNAVASVLDVREAAGLELAPSLAEHLAHRTALLVLDNCEHVIDAAAALVHELLTGAPDLVILATSQAPLGTPDETTFAVLPLAVPAEHDTDLDRLTGTPAVQLFVERAQRANRSFSSKSLGSRRII